MKRLYSEVFKEHFWLSEDRTKPVNTEPCFSKVEMQHLKNAKGNTKLLALIFESKKMGCIVNEVLIDKLKSRCETDNLSYTSNTTKPKQRDELIKTYASSIREDLAKRTIKGLK